MKNLTKNMMFAAAAMVVAAGVVQAQAVKAEIPFSFRASGTVMPAGEYWVGVHRSSGGSAILSVLNRETHGSVLATPFVASDRGAVGPQASLTFQCGGAHCALIKVADGTGMVYQFPSPHVGKGENSRLAVIRAVLVNAR